jgi:DNA-binding NarL/FixJ family response regulator
MATIAVVDDHKLMRSGLANLLRQSGHQVVFEADNGVRFQESIDLKNPPEIVLLDINMPLMDGQATATWIRTHCPEIKMLVLSMYDDERSIIRMIKAGAKGYILKDCEPRELQMAIQALSLRGYYTCELVSSTLMHTMNDPTGSAAHPALENLTEKERHFLQLACTEMTYKEIAELMFVSPRTLEDYRDELYRKLKIRSRVGLVLFAVRNGLIHP